MRTGDTLRSRAALDVFRLDRCTRQYAALRIMHNPGNFSGVRLPLRQRRRSGQHDPEQRQTLRN